MPLGSAEISLGKIIEEPRIRIPLQSNDRLMTGFVSMTTFLPEERKYPRSPAKHVEPTPRYGHRRTQSLPPKLGIKLNIPPAHKLSSVFVNPTVKNANFHTFFHSLIFTQLISCLSGSYISFAFGSGWRYKRLRNNDGKSIVLYYTAAATVRTNIDSD